MAKQSVAAMQAELAELKKLILGLSTKAPLKKKAAKAENTSSFYTVTRDNAKSEQYGIEYCIINVPGSRSEAGFVPDHPESFAELRAVRYGSHDKGKFRWDRGARAFSGQTAFVPAVVTKNLVK